MSVVTRARLSALAILFSACAAPRVPVSTAATVDSVRAFMGSVARGITAGGPAAWRGIFVDDSTFFMASEGRLVFPSSDALTRGIDQLKQVIATIELTWGDTIRVDPLAPGLAAVGASYHEIRVDRDGHHVDERGYFTGIAERRATGWQLRDAHWSVLAPPAAVP